MRRATLRAAIYFLSGGALVAACTSSSNSPPPSDAASAPGLDAGTFDSAAPSEDAGSPVDAGHDATIPDGGGSVDSGGPGVDASDSAVADATDSAVADASPGTVSSPSGLQLTSFRQDHTATRLNDGRVLFCGG